MKTKYQLLLTAINNEDLQSLDSLLKDKDVLDEILRNQGEALDAAVDSRNLAVVERLLKTKVVQDNVARNDNEALRRAIITCDVPDGEIIVLRLLDEELVQKNLAANKNQALRYAVKNNLASVIKILLTDKNVLEHLAADDYLKRRIMYYTIENHQPTILHHLLKPKVLGVKIFQKPPTSNDEGILFEALCKACEKGYLNIVEILLREKSILDLVNKDNNAALRAAAGAGSLSVLNRLLQEKAVLKMVEIDLNAALNEAAKNGHLLVVKRLLQEKAVQDEFGRIGAKTILNAATHGQLSVVEYLLKSNIKKEDQFYSYPYEPHQVLRTCIVDHGYQETDMRIPILERLLKEKIFRDNIANYNHRVLKEALQEHGNCALGLCYLIIDTYKANGLELPDPNSLGNISKYILNYLKDEDAETDTTIDTKTRDDSNSGSINIHPLEKLYKKYRARLKTAYDSVKETLPAMSINPLIFSFPKPPHEFSMLEIEKIHAAFFDVWTQEVMDDPILIKDTFGGQKEDAFGRPTEEQSKLYSKSSLSSALENYKNTKKQLIASMPDLQNSIDIRLNTQAKIHAELVGIEFLLSLNDDTLGDGTRQKLEADQKKQTEKLQTLENEMLSFKYKLSEAEDKKNEKDSFIKDPIRRTLLLKDGVQNQGQDAKNLQAIAFAAVFIAIQNNPNIKKAANIKQLETINFFQEHYGEDQPSLDKLSDPKKSHEHAEITKRQAKLKKDKVLLEKFLNDPKDPSLNLSKEQVKQLNQFRVYDINLAKAPKPPQK